MGIHFVTCITRKNGLIVGVSSEETDSLGNKSVKYWPAGYIYEIQDTMEYETIDGQKIAKGIHDFSVRSRDGSRSVGIHAEIYNDEFHIPIPSIGDADLLQNLPECNL